MRMHPAASIHQIQMAALPSLIAVGARRRMASLPSHKVHVHGSMHAPPVGWDAHVVDPGRAPTPEDQTNGAGAAVAAADHRAR